MQWQAKSLPDEEEGKQDPYDSTASTPPPSPLRTRKLPLFDDTIRRIFLLLMVFTGSYYILARWENVVATSAYAAIPFVLCESWLFLYVLIDAYVSWYSAKRIGRDLRDILPDTSMYPKVDVST